MKYKMSEYTDLDFKPLVFIHIPKTAGTSFRLAAERVIEPEAILKDYGANSPSTSQIVLDTVYNKSKGNKFLSHEIVQNKVQFFTGHIHAVDYLNIFDCNVRWCTFLRDPIKRVISEYNHVVRHYGYAQSLEWFCSQERNINKQYKILSGLKLEDFYFVGITEYYKESLDFFNKLTHLNIPYLERNVRKKSGNEQMENAELLKEMKYSNAQDIELYEEAKVLLNKKLEEVRSLS